MSEQFGILNVNRVGKSFTVSFLQTILKPNLPMVARKLTSKIREGNVSICVVFPMIISKCFLTSGFEVINYYCIRSTLLFDLGLLLATTIILVK